MNLLAEFIGCECDEKDIIVSFAIRDNVLLVRSLILSRTLFHEEYLDEECRGVKVSYEGDLYEDEMQNTLESVEFKEEKIYINAKYSKYVVDSSKLEDSDIVEVKKLLKKQNYDNRFKIKNA